MYVHTYILLRLSHALALGRYFTCAAAGYGYVEAHSSCSEELGWSIVSMQYIYSTVYTYWFPSLLTGKSRVPDRSTDR